jgi:cleavage and polyadenylation specificity factor subunit 1
LLAKDYQPLSVYGSEFLVHQQSLGFLVSDASKNVQIYQYLPQSLESRGGLMLLSKADFHLGSRAEKFVRLRMNSAKDTTTKSQKHATVFGTHDGGIGCVAPVEELVFKRLFALQNRMTVYLPHFAGLNPKAFRAMKLERKVLRNHYGNVLDGELLFR